MNDVFKDLKENNYQPWVLYLRKLSFIIKGEIKTFHDKQKVKAFMKTKIAQLEVFTGILHTEE
jgi:hypothetical protein